MAGNTQGRRLKVYWAEIDGLNEWVVAAPNRPEALAAFGVNQDLFAQGEAGDASDPAAIEAAREQPLTPLRRPKGSPGPFAPADGLGDWSAAIPKESLAKPASPKARGPAKAEPPPPDRQPLERAKAKLEEVERRHREALQRLEEDRRRLQDRSAREDADYAAGAAEARRAVKAAERAFRAAGGRH